MTKKVQLTIILVLMLAFAGSAFALEHTVGIRGGVTLPFHDIDEDATMKLMGGISYEAWLKDYLSLGIAPYYTGMEAGEPIANYKASVIGADLNLKYRPVKKFALNYPESTIRRISPFVNLGIGLANYSTEGNIGATDFDESKAVFVAPSAGLGVSFQTKWDVNVDLGAQFEHPFDDKFDQIDTKANDSYLMPYLGIGYTFGSKKAKEVVQKVQRTLLRDRISMEQDFTLKGVQFEINSANLTPEARKILDEVATEMKKYPKVKIEIHGHTDNTGSKELNDALSLKRAESVKDYLISQEIASERMATQGFGFSRPIASNNTEEGRAENRRIEFVIVK